MMSRFEIYKGKGKCEEIWRWRLKASNHQIMATGGEEFRSKQNVLNSIKNVKEEIGRSEILFENK